MSYYFSKYSSAQNFFKSGSGLKIVRVVLIFSLLTSLLAHALVFVLYIDFIHMFSKAPLYGDISVFPKIGAEIGFESFEVFSVGTVSLYFTLDAFGLILLTLAYAVGFISILALDTRLY